MDTLFLIARLSREWHKWIVTKIKNEPETFDKSEMRDSNVDIEIQFPESEGHIWSCLDVSTGHALKAKALV